MVNGEERQLTEGLFSITTLVDEDSRINIAKS